MDDAAAVRKPCGVCDGPGGWHCTKCKSRHYCSKACQLIDWYERGHKAQCKRLAAEFQDRLLDALMPEKLKIKEAPPIVDDVAPAAGSKAAARLSAAWTTALVKPRALDDATLAWGGDCAICLEVLPLGEGRRQAFYECCCKRLCTDCSDKCEEYDTRCPLCRAPRRKSDAEWLRRVQEHADEGNTTAQTELGNAYFRGDKGLEQSSKRAVHWFKLAAARGHAIAQTMLGNCYENGYSVKINFETAARWFRRAAEQGFPIGQFNYGNMLRNGQGVAQSDEEAVRLWRLSAAQGYAAASYNLGHFHLIGRGTPRDQGEALRCFKRAAALGLAEAAEAAEAAENLEAELETRNRRPA